MAGDGFGRLFRFTSWGESHGPALGCVVEGVPPGISLSEDDIQPWLDKRRPGGSRFVTQRQEPDAVEILSGVYEGVTTGTPISLMIRNQDQRSKDYSEIARQFRPGHADFTYWAKYRRVRDPRGGGRSSARETAVRVAAGAVARKLLAAELKTAYGDAAPDLQIRAALVAIGGDPIDRAAWAMFHSHRRRSPCVPTSVALEYQLARANGRTHKTRQLWATRTSWRRSPTSSR